MTAQGRLEDFVHRAWCEALGSETSAGRWEEVGGDSLATLQLVYRLEQLLGRDVPFDLMRGEMTAADLVDDLAGPGGGSGADAAPLVFLLPGQLGDGPSLASFRRRLSGQVRFELVGAEDADHAAATLRDLDATARHVVAQIEARQPDGPVFIAGYSFGGSVALAAAAALLEAGRTVAHVAVFDGAFSDATLGGPRPSLRHRLRRHAGRAMSGLLAWDAGRRGLLTAADRLVPQHALTFRRFVLRRFRTDARLNWRPPLLAVPMFLALSDEFAPAAGPVWRRLYPQAEAIPVPGTHFGLFRGEALEVVATAFERYLAQHVRPAAGRPRERVLEVVGGV